MRERGTDLMLLSPSSDLAYLTGYHLSPSERLTCLALPVQGEPHLLVPELESPRARAAVPDIEIDAWSETEDPFRRLKQISGVGRRIAVADQMWARHLLALQEVFTGAQFAAASGVLRALRVRKDADEIRSLRQAAAAADRAYERLRAEVRFSGRPERDVARELGEILVEEGHQTVSFCIVASGPNAASPHHAAGERVIAGDELVVCDFGGLLDGYGSDITRTVYTGRLPPEPVRRVHDTVRRAQEAASSAVGIGVAAQEVDRAARRVIAEAGYAKAFVHRTGHGIGLDGHEDPYLVEGNAESLDTGMTFSIEPGVYLDGQFGVRLEDIFVLTSSGLEPLNVVDHSLAPVR
jgi:Xaa-Pro aminopeptidase